MITTILIVSASGVVLFQRQFSGKLKQASMVGSLLTAVQEFASSNIEMFLRSARFEKSAISFASDAATKTVCVLFHDLEDSDRLGSLLADGIIRSFVDQYSAKLEQRGAAISTADFASFHSRLPACIRTVYDDVLSNVSSQRGVLLAALKQPILRAGHTDAPMLVHTGGELSSRTVDTLALDVNVMGLLNCASDLLSSSQDAPRALEVHGPSGSIMLWPKRGFCLLVRINGTAHAPHIAAKADESLDICCQIQSLLIGIGDE